MLSETAVLNARLLPELSLAFNTAVSIVSIALIFAGELCGYRLNRVNGSLSWTFLWVLECGKLLLNTLFPEEVAK